MPKKPPPAEGAPLEAPPEGPPRAPPEDLAEGATRGRKYAIWLLFTQENAKNINTEYLDSQVSNEKAKRLQFTQ